MVSVIGKKVVLLGKGELAVRAAGWLADDPSHDLLCVVPVVPEPTWTTSLMTWAREHDVRAVESGHYRDVGDLVGGTTIDLGVSIFYDKIIRPAFIDRCERIINLHNAPLPRYRGVSPINWALKNEEREHGVTIHELAPGIDDGDIISQVRYSIYPEIDEVADVYARAIEYAWVLFQQTMPVLDQIRSAPQDEAAATYYSRDQDHLLGDRRSWTRVQ